MTVPATEKNSIYALSTPYGTSAIAAIRISFPEDTIAAQSLKELCHKNIELIRAREAILCPIYEEDGSIIDKVIIIYFPAPNSFTGENMLEIFPHGGIAVIDAMLNRLQKISYLRPAKSGEFSRRAFLNGKMDLLEVEALNTFIHAETSEQKRIAQQQLYNINETSLPYRRWREMLIKIMAQIEAYIDFPDDDIPSEILGETEKVVKKLSAEIKDHLITNNKSSQLTDGIKIAIVGQPNVGKSTIINLLAREDIAIVSNIAGTTRDVVRVRLNIGGFLVNLSDTAGIRDNDGDTIESEGIVRSYKAANRSDLIVIVLDQSQEIGNQITRLQKIIEIPLPKLFILNKKDLVSYNKSSIDDFFLKGNNCNEVVNVISFSAHAEKAHDELLKIIEKLIRSLYPKLENMLPINHRQRCCLEECLVYLSEFSLFKSLDLAAQDIRFAVSALSMLFGEIGNEEILDKIFRDFCIGK